MPEPANYFQPYNPVFNSNGVPVPGAQVFFYTSTASGGGTSTKAPIYADAELTVELPNPVTANSASRLPAIYLEKDKFYRVVTRAAPMENGSPGRLLEEVDPFVPGEYPAGPKGDPGAAGNVAASIEQLQAADPANVSMIYNGAVYAFTLGNYTDRADDINIVKQDDTALTVGAWVVQKPIKSFEDFFPIGKTLATITMEELKASIDLAWQSALANGHDLLHPGGVYEIDYHFPWRQEALPGDLTELLDCKNITIWGNGPQSVFKTARVDGADVFQLNGLKNFHCRNLALTAEVPGILDPGFTRIAGSNGFSITGGFDNITILDCYCFQLAGFWVTDHMDGGKALTIQCDNANPALPIGSLTARIYVQDCIEGFGTEPNLFKHATKATAINVWLHAERCAIGYKSSAAPPSGALPTNFKQGVTVRGKAVDCQRSVVLARSYGDDAEIETVTTLSKAARRMNTAVPGINEVWDPTNTEVLGLFALGVKNANRINVFGNLGDCDRKAIIGGATGGTFQANGSTADSNIMIDLAGTASTADITVLNDVNGFNVERVSLIASDATGAIPGVIDTLASKNALGNGRKSRTGWRGALLGLSADVTGISATGGYNIEWTAETEDADGFHTPGVPAVIVIPAGVKRVKVRAQVSVGNVTANDTIVAVIQKNSSSAYAGSAETQGKSDFTLVRAEMETPAIPVVQGDAFSVRITANTDTSVDVMAAGTWFSVEVVE